jgi:ribonucleoside-diphosphate reductase alpha chain
MAIQARETGSVDSNGRHEEATVVGTVLEGVRAKVFLDRYSLKSPEGKPIEQTPEEMWRRVARGIAAVEPTPEARARWEEEFYRALDDFRFVPGGRVLSSAGSGFETTYYNCFQGDTPVHTRDGIVPIGSLSGMHNVLSQGGVYRPAFFKSYGHQRLWQVTLANGSVFFATADHQWVVTQAKGGTTRVPTRDLLGRRIPINARPAPARDEEFAEGARHGIVYGDGSMQYGKAHVCLFGESETLARWFDGHSARSAGDTVATKAHVRVYSLPAAWKRLPLPEASPSYWRGFVAGLIAADGHVDARGSVMLHNKDADALARIAEGMASAGLVASSIMLARATSPFDGSDKPLYCLRFFKETISADDLLLASHRENFERSPKARHSTIQVIEVTETDRLEEVFCCVEPETHTITIGHGYLTGQCFVIPSPDDSRGGILDNLKILTEIMARGGGVGVNLSTLRPRGSYIKTVNGTASGPVSWAELYSVITGDVIQQGGSRRGALMVMLDDDHPDVMEFIHAKKIDPLTNRPVAIEHANISVAVSDPFMQAVKDDAEWPTQFPTKAMVAADPSLAAKVTPGPTFQAREIWRAICASAWATAEPGVIFIDHYNDMNNTWYYQTIRCTNPCGEQGLSPWSVCNLAALNLSSFVSGPIGAGEFDYAALERFARVGLRFSDDVIDANLYFIDENAEEQLGTRRTGLGTMGLADALIKMGVRYGSPESEPIVERIYRTIRDAAYDESANLAAEKGVFPRFDREKYAQGKFIQSLPAAIQEKIGRQGIRNAVILTQAPTGCLVPNTLVPTDRGLLPLDALGHTEGERWQPTDLSVVSTDGVRPADQFYINGAAPTLRVTTRRGYTIQGTHQHRIKVWEAGALVWRRLEDLAPGMRVPLQATGLIGVERPVSLDVQASEHFNNQSITLPPLMTTDLAYLIGFFMGDGSLKRRSLRFACSGAAVVERLISLSERLFGVSPKISSDRRSLKLVSVEVHSTRLVEFWRKNGFAKQAPGPAHRGKGYQPHIPLAVLATNSEAIYGAFLAGLIDADGTVWNGHTVSMTTVDRAFHNHLKTMLLTLGVYTQTAVHRAEAGNRLGRRETYRLQTCNAQSARRLIERLPLLCRVRISEPTVRREGYGDVLPVGGDDFVRSLRGVESSIQQIVGSARFNGRISRTMAERVRQARPDILVDDSALLTALEQDLYADEIVAVEDGGVRPTYDLSVPGTHAYIANGFISHNTTSLLAGVSSGIEPVFDFAYRRVDRTGESVIYHPLLKQWMDDHPGEERADYFVGANDLTPEDHIRVQAMVQRYTDSSISKTCNAPNSHTVEEVERLYQMAYESGCKGVTYYRDGSRDAVLHHIDDKKKGEQAAEAPKAEAAAAVIDRTIRPRPTIVQGYTRNMQAPEGKVNITLNSDEQGLLEVFVNVGRAGSDIAALAEALGRLISLMQRLPSPLTADERAQLVANQLRGIGGSRTVGFGLEQVRSLPDALGLALQKHLEGQVAPTPARAAAPAQQPALPGLLNGGPKMTGNLCPDCGSTAFVFEEGCKKCHACGYSEC